MKNNIKQPKSEEEIAGIANEIIYKINNSEVSIIWLERELMQLYCDGVLLGREQIINRDKITG